MITIKEVAELAQVSQATVSRTLNGHSSVKEANKQKVYAAMEELGYQLIRLRRHSPQTALAVLVCLSVRLMVPFMGQ
ncbi:maltose operon transcriptional repressor MalR LacI family [Vibrio variabilis]|uniref:Maltose operon transcriptional repressor MalR LacI family n=1 Tax=Vibrio variabilis TaxID=990271 RepID=A0ABQ0JP02_9VIBR|nr:maltose operon transcriptional repressor MalR LacI family [Vibrio variabilis]